jgi:hypothetical protein
MITAARIACSIGRMNGTALVMTAARFVTKKSSRCIAKTLHFNLARAFLPWEEAYRRSSWRIFMTQHFVVSYEIDYVHRVSVGIEAESPEVAQQVAEQAFNEATIWDDTAAMPLLADDYQESGDERLVWECVAVERWPATDTSVQQLKKEQAAMHVCLDWSKPIDRAKPTAGASTGKI